MGEFSQIVAGAATATPAPAATNPTEGDKGTNGAAASQPAGNGFDLSKYPELASKSFKSLDDLVKSYTSLESKYSKEQNEWNAVQKELERIAPHWEKFEAQLAAEEAALKANVTNKDSSDPQYKKMLTDLNKQVESIKRDSEERLTKTAIATASRSFAQDYPDAKNHAAEITAIMNSGKININDPTDPNELYEALTLANSIVMAQKSAKIERGKAASGVEAGSGATSANEGNKSAWAMKKEDLLAKITGDN